MKKGNILVSKISHIGTNIEFFPQSWKSNVEK